MRCLIEHRDASPKSSASQQRGAPEYLKLFLLKRFPFSALKSTPFAPLRRKQLFFFTICNRERAQKDAPRPMEAENLQETHRTVHQQPRACQRRSGEAAMVLKGLITRRSSSSMLHRVRGSVQSDLLSRQERCALPFLASRAQLIHRALGSG